VLVDAIKEEYRYFGGVPVVCFIEVLAAERRMGRETLTNEPKSRHDPPMVLQVSLLDSTALPYNPYQKDVTENL
jgi:hypothetical protein